MKRKLITISGPTASGKTKLSIDLALRLNCSIISSDSRQFYKEMNIGTAVPSKNELSKIKHYCVQHKSINDKYTINDFQIEALDIINHELKFNDYIIMVGGSGMYMDSVTNGMDTFPNISSKISETINSNFKLFGIKYLQDKLNELDPEYFSKVDVNNHRRLIRAIEVSMSSNKPYSSYLGNKKVNQTAANKLIIKLGGINKTNKLAKSYFDETIKYANKIKKLSVKQEMIELANIAINRDK